MKQTKKYSIILALFPYAIPFRSSLLVSCLLLLCCRGGAWLDLYCVGAEDTYGVVLHPVLLIVPIPNFATAPGCSNGDYPLAISLDLPHCLFIFGLWKSRWGSFYCIQVWKSTFSKPRRSWYKEMGTFDANSLHLHPTFPTPKSFQVLQLPNA